MADSPRLFLVVRIGWKVSAWDPTYTQVSPDFLDRTGEDRRFIPVAGFADRTSAETRAWELELEAARLFNPFWRLGGLNSLLPHSEFISRLGNLVGALPEAETVNSNRVRLWAQWWAEQMPEWSDATLAAVWKLFDEIRFYDVVEVEVE